MTGSKCGWSTDSEFSTVQPRRLKWAHQKGTVKTSKIQPLNYEALLCSKYKKKYRSKLFSFQQAKHNHLCLLLLATSSTSSLRKKRKRYLCDNMLHALYFTLLKFSYPRISGDTFFLFDFPTFFLEAQHLKDEELTPTPPLPRYLFAPYHFYV